MTWDGLTVVKLGGRSFEAREDRLRQARAIARAAKAGAKLVVCHGGGAQISAALKAAGIEPAFVDGLRVTDAKTLEVMEPVATALGKDLAHALTREGAPALALTGRDAALVEATVKDARLGRVGTVARVNADLLRHLAGSRLTPVIGPLAVDAEGALNVNADEVASAVARALHAQHLVLLTDVDGVKDAAAALIPRLTPAEAEGLIAAGVATGGMIPKIRGALAALAGGVGAVHVVNGQRADTLERLLAGEAVGTVFTPQE